MPSETPPPPLREYSPLTALMRVAFRAATALAPMFWLRWASQYFKSRWEFKPHEVTVEFAKRRAKLVEYYVAGWLLVEAALVMLVFFVPLSSPWRYGVGLIASLRILEIIQVAVNATVFDQMGTGRDNWIASAPRMLVLAFVNFMELVVCFGAVYAADFTRLHGAGQAATAFYFSVITQLTVGYGDVYPIGYMRIFAAAQGLASLLFVVLVFARFVGVLPRMESMFDVRAAEADAAVEHRAGNRRRDARS